MKYGQNHANEPWLMPEKNKLGMTEAAEKGDQRTKIYPFASLIVESCNSQKLAMAFSLSWLAMYKLTDPKHHWTTIFYAHITQGR